GRNPPGHNITGGVSSKAKRGAKGTRPLQQCRGIRSLFGFYVADDFEERDPATVGSNLDGIVWDVYSREGALTELGTDRVAKCLELLEPRIAWSRKGREASDTAQRVGRGRCRQEGLETINIFKQQGRTIECHNVAHSLLFFCRIGRILRRQA